MILLMAGLAGFVNVNISTSCSNYNPDTRYEKIIVEKKIHSSAQIWSKVRVWPEKAWPETEIMRQMKKSYGQSLDLNENLISFILLDFWLLWVFS